MASVNIDIFGTIRLIWMRMGKFNSADHYTYYCGQESLRRKGVALIMNKGVQMQCFGEVLKTKKWSQFFFRQTIQHNSNPSLCPKHSCQRSWSQRVLWRPTRLSRISTKNGGPFHHSGLQYKSRKLTDTWSNRQVWPWSTKWSKEKINRVLWRQYSGQSKHPFPTT